MKEIYNFFVRVEVLLLGVAIYLCNTVVVITITQLLLTLKFGLIWSTGLNPVWGVVEMYDTDNLRQWHQLEIRLNVFFDQSTILQKQFLITITVLGELWCRKNKKTAFYVEDLCKLSSQSIWFKKEDHARFRIS